MTTDWIDDAANMMLESKVEFVIIQRVKRGNRWEYATRMTLKAAVLRDMIRALSETVDTMEAGDYFPPDEDEPGKSTWRGLTEWIPFGCEALAAGGATWRRMN